jgi:phage terminase large subunit-like protein
MRRDEFEALLLQRQKLEEALRVLREKKRLLRAQAQKNPLALYRPTLPETCEYGDSQLVFHRSLAKERLLYGANRSGKTEAGAAESAMHVSGDYQDFYPRDGRILDGETKHRPITVRCYATNFKNGINEIMWPKLLKYLPKDLHVEPQRGTKGEVEAAFLPNGVRVLFGTYNQSESSERGTEADFVWFDEPPDSEERYLEIARGTLDRGGRIILTMTPLDCEWLDQSILAQATRDPEQRYRPFVAYLDIRDNRYIPEEEKAWWVARLSEEQRFSRVMGRPKSLLSTVYQEWDAERHIIPAFDLPFRDGHPDGWNLFHAVDPHDAYPPAMVWFAVFDPKMGGGLSKVFVVHEDWGDNNLIASAVDRIVKVEEGLGAVSRGRVMDPNFGGKKTSVTGDTIQGEYHKASVAAGHRMTFRLGTDNHAVGHEAVRKLLATTMPSGPWAGRPQLEVFDRCHRVAASFRFYRRKKPGMDAVIDDKHKHWADAVRYFAVARFRYVDEYGDAPMRKLTMIEKIIEDERSVAMEPLRGGAEAGPLFAEREESGLISRF